MIMRKDSFRFSGQNHFRFHLEYFGQRIQSVYLPKFLGNRGESTQRSNCQQWSLSRENVISVSALPRTDLFLLSLLELAMEACDRHGPCVLVQVDLRRSPHSVRTSSMEKEDRELSRLGWCKVGQMKAPRRVRGISVDAFDIKRGCDGPPL